MSDVPDASVFEAFAALAVPAPGTCDDDPKPFSEWIELSRGARLALDGCLAPDLPLALELAFTLELGYDVPPAEPPPEAPPALEEPLAPPFEPVPEEEPPPPPDLELRRWGAASARAASRGMA
jgi:hypothetical protein